MVFSIRIGKSLFYGHLKISYTLHQLFLSSLLLIGPSLWFYYLHLFKKSIKKSDYILHYGAFVALVFLSFFIDLSNEAYFYLGIFSHGLLYCSYIFYNVFKNKRLKQGKPFFKWMLLLTSVTILLFLNSILIFFKALPFYPTSAFLFSLIILLLFIYGLNNLDLFRAEKKKYASSNLTKEEADTYYQKLKELVEKDKLYLDAELSLTKLSKLIGISTKELSQVINQIENSNYSQYIMIHRVEEVKKRLKKPKYDNYKISAIAFESGFNSVSSFNNAFKKITNTTAVKYRAS